MSDTLNSLNLVVDNDFSAYCARLRLVLKAAVPHAVSFAAEETPGVIPGWRIDAATQLRDWYRDDVIAFAFDCAAHRAEQLNRRAVQKLVAAGENPTTRGFSYQDSLPHAAVTIAQEVAQNAVDAVPWALWLADVTDVIDGHDWFGVAVAIWDTLKAENPAESIGEWSAGDIAERTQQDVAAVSEALDALVYHDIARKRYVGGTSSHLYHLRPETALPDADV